MRKTILILVDGMRPDSLSACGHPFPDVLLNNSISNLAAQTVFPSVTLPCHMSLFHSVVPQRHGILSNTYTPQVRPVCGLIDLLSSKKKSTAMFYNWEELRDLSRPGALALSCCLSQSQIDGTDRKLTDSAIHYVEQAKPDFLFLYLGETDEVGHKYGWMTKPYLEAVRNAMSCIQDVFERFSDEYALIVTADHGGHLFMHGTQEACDMTIPILIAGVPGAKASKKMQQAEITDLAPTIAMLLGVKPDAEWTGRSLLC
ncbi:MAG: alkaline phosphatase family protein [Clostridiaceae bacterium]